MSNSCAQDCAETTPQRTQARLCEVRARDLGSSPSLAPGSLGELGPLSSRLRNERVGQATVAREHLVALVPGSTRECWGEAVFLGNSVCLWL